MAVKMPCVKRDFCIFCVWTGFENVLLIGLHEYISKLFNMLWVNGTWNENIRQLLVMWTGPLTKLDHWFSCLICKLNWKSLLENTMYEQGLIMYDLHLMWTGFKTSIRLYGFVKELLKWGKKKKIPFRLITMWTGHISSIDLGLYSLNNVDKKFKSFIQIAAFTVMRKSK